MTETAPTESNPERVKETNPLITTAVVDIKKDANGRFASFTNRFFRRYMKWPQPQRSIGRWKDLRPQHEINQATIVGDFYHPSENANYRILGMRPKRNVGESVEYDVSRLPKNSIQMRGFVSEYLPRDSVDHIMRLCCSEDVEEQERFIHSYQLMAKMHVKSSASTIRKHFPVIMGGGAFPKLFYKDYCEEYNNKIHCVHFLHRPRPYFIYERIGLTLEDLIRGSYQGFIDISTACQLTIGIIKALRAIHALDYVHRCVTPYTFSLKTYPGGMLNSDEISKAVVCNDLSYSTIYRSSKKPHNLEKVFYGTIRYSSPDTMRFRQQYPRDDIISAIYIFVELCHGRLAWRHVKDPDVVIEKKEAFFETPTIMVDNSDPDYRIPIDIRDLTLIFKMLKESNPYSGPLNYLYVFEILHRIAEANRNPSPDAESYLDVAKLAEVEAAFYRGITNLQKGNTSQHPTTKTSKTTMTRTVGLEHHKSPANEGEIKITMENTVPTKEAMSPMKGKKSSRKVKKESKAVMKLESPKKTQSSKESGKQKSQKENLAKRMINKITGKSAKQVPPSSTTKGESTKQQKSLDNTQPLEALPSTPESKNPKTLSLKSTQSHD